MHPYLKESRDGHASKLKRLAGFHGTSDNPSGNKSPKGTKGGSPANAERAGEVIENGPQQADGLASLNAEGKSPKRNLGKFARGGRAKHKGTNVNVIIGHPGGTGAPPIPSTQALPMPHAMVPPGQPPMPGPPGAGGPPGMPPGLPPSLPPGMPMRKSGGRAFKRGGRTFNAGAGTGEGREEKTKAYGKKSRMKSKAV